MTRRARQPKSIVNFESETEKEIRSDLEGRIAKSSLRVFLEKR